MGSYNRNWQTFFSNTGLDDFIQEKKQHNKNMKLKKQKMIMQLNGNELLNQNEYGDHEKISWWWEPADTTTKEFFADSSMHGLKYLSQTKRHLFERIFWLALFCTGIGLATYLINQLWERYDSTPVMVSFSSAEVGLSSITFPAITICNMNKLRKSVVDTINRSIATNASAVNYLRDARAICDGQKSFSNYFDYAYKRGRIDSSQLEQKTSTEGTDDATNQIKNFIEEKTLSCSEVIRLCRWAGIAGNCSELFADVITEYGRCCTFNSLPKELMQKGFDKELKQELEANNTKMKDWEEWTHGAKYILPDDWNKTYPKSQDRAGSTFGLSISIAVDVTDYFCPSTDSEGFRIMFHSPLEMPQMQHGLSIGLGNEIYMKVIPELTLADDDIKDFKREKRQCMLKKETSLDYYNHYTKRNCMSECNIEAIIHECNCSFYYMPDAAKNHTSRPCNVTMDSDDVKCNDKIMRNAPASLKTCYKICYPQCTDILFRIESTSSKLQNEIWNDTDPQANMTNYEWGKYKVSIIHIFNGDLSTLPRIRKALYSTTDLIASIGGLLGLCLGFSLLSAVEIIYYFTFRECVKKMRRRHVASAIEVDERNHGNNMVFGKRNRRIGENEAEMYNNNNRFGFY